MDQTTSDTSNKSDQERKQAASHIVASPEIPPLDSTVTDSSPVHLNNDPEVEKSRKETSTPGDGVLTSHGHDHDAATD